MSRYTRTFTTDQMRLLREAITAQSRSRVDAARRSLYVRTGDHPRTFTTEQVDAVDPGIRQLDDLLDMLPDPDNPEQVVLGGPGGRIHDEREAAYDEFG